jgi:hypothetical protein
MAWKVTAVVATALVLGTAGCGGGSSSSSGASGTTTAAQSTTPATTEAQRSTTTTREKPPKEPFARQVFDACQQREAQLNAVSTRVQQQKPRGEFGDIGRALPPIETARLTAFEAITPPAAKQSRFDQLKTALQARRDELAEWAKANPTGIISKPVIRAIERSGQRAQALVRALKLKCSI